MTIQVPSIWDYLAGAGYQGLDSYKDRRRYDEEQAYKAKVLKQQEDMNILGVLAQGAATGAINSGQASANPVAQGRGIVFAPSQPEMARNIAARPNKGATVSAGFPGSPVPNIQMTQYSDDERRVAGLPTGAQMAVERKEGKKANIESQVTGFEQYQPALTEAAERFVSGAINSGIDSERFPQMVATNAYQQWLREQASSGDMAVMDPGLRQYAKSFFDNAVQKINQRKVELRALTTRAENAGSGSDDRVRWAALLEKRKNDIMEQFQVFKMLPTEKLLPYVTPGNPRYNQNMANAYNEVQAINQGITELATGKMTAPTLQLIQNAGGGQVVQPQAGGNPSGAQAMTPDVLQRAIELGRQVAPEQRKMWLESKRATVTPEDYSKIASAIGVKP